MCQRRDKKNITHTRITQRLNVFECLIDGRADCLSVCASLECLSVDFLLLCLVLHSKSGAVGTSRRADARGESQQRGGGDGEGVHVIAVCWLPTRRQGQAHPLSHSFTTLNIHIYPQPFLLSTDSTSTPYLNLCPPPPLALSTSPT